MKNKIKTPKYMKLKKEIKEQERLKIINGALVSVLIGIAIALVLIWLKG